MKTISNEESNRNSSSGSIQKVKLVTWNVNGIRASYDKGLSEFIEQKKPDILCLQETKAFREQVEVDRRDLGYAASFWSSAERKGYSGVATFCNEKPQRIFTSIDKPEYEAEGRIVWSRHKYFDLYNIYFPNGSSGPERHQFKQKFLRDLLAHLKFELRKGREIILVGDYNVAYLEHDVFDPIALSSESGFFPEERTWFNQFLSAGFIDCFRHIHPQKKDVYSWWSYKEMSRARNRGWRIDHICVSSGLVSNIKTCEILMSQQGSDHCPVVVELEF